MVYLFLHQKPLVNCFVFLLVEDQFLTTSDNLVEEEVDQLRCLVMTLHGQVDDSVLEDLSFGEETPQLLRDRRLPDPGDAFQSGEAVLRHTLDQSVHVELSTNEFVDARLFKLKARFFAQNLDFTGREGSQRRALVVGFCLFQNEEFFSFLVDGAVWVVLNYVFGFEKGFTDC